MARCAWLGVLALAACRPSPPAAPTPKSIALRDAPPSVPNDADRIVEVVAGPYSNCARSRSGRIACWGRSVVFDETAGHRHVPVAIDVPPAVGLAAGDAHWCVLAEDGGVWCWGRNRSQVLGRPTVELHDYRPGPVVGLEPAEEVVARGDHTCARLQGGSVVCWGVAGRRVTASLPAGPLTIDGSDRCCAQNPLRCDGDDRARSESWMAFGFSDESQQLTKEPRVRELSSLSECSVDANGTVTCFSRYGGPDAPSPMGTVVEGQLSLGVLHVCGIDIGGLAWCAGDDSVHQVGAASSLGEVVSIAAGAFHTCAVTREGRLWCWGLGTSGEVGLPPLEAEVQPKRIEVPGRAQRVARYEEHICVQTSEGVFCPAESCAGAGFESTGYEALATRDEHSCLYTLGGRMICRAPSGGSDGPAPPADFLDAQLDMMLDHRWCASKGSVVRCETLPSGRGDDSLYSLSSDGDADTACGIDSRKRLVCATRDGGTVHETRADGPFTEVSVYERTVRRADGTLVRLRPGWNGVELEDIPVPGIVQASRSQARFCGVDRDGRAWCWDGEAEPVEIPTRVRAVATHEHHACAIDEEGALWCWGRNERGQSGLGGPRCAKAPIDLTDAVMRAMEGADADPG